jgi:hypothetical protein
MLLKNVFSIPRSFFVFLFGAVLMAPTDSGASADSVEFEVVGQWGGISRATALRAGRCYLGVGIRLLAFDIRQPDTAVLLGASEILPGVPRDVVLRDKYAYVVTGNGHLRVLDVSGVSPIRQVGGCRVAREACALAIHGQYALVAAKDQGLVIVDIGKPTAPVVVGGWRDTLDDAVDIAVSAKTACVADWERGLVLLNISDPTHPILMGAQDVPGRVLSVAAESGRAYVGTQEASLVIVDVSDPKRPKRLGACQAEWEVSDVAAAGELVYAADGEIGLLIIDASDTSNPKRVGQVEMEGGAVAVAVEQSRAAVVQWGRGLVVLDISAPPHPSKTATFKFGDLPLAATIDDQRALFANPDRGLQIIDITDPTAPREDGVYGAGGFAHGAAVLGDYVCLADGPYGLRVVDKSNPAVPRLVATANTDGYSLGIAVKESYAWIADAAGGIKCFSLAIPAHPQLVSELPAMGSAYAIAIDGDFAYVTCPHRGVQVVDITNPDAPRAVSEIGIPDVVAISPVIGDRIYVLGEAGRLAAYDITSPVQPVLIRESKIDGAPRSVAVTDGRAYLVDGDRQLDIVELHDSEGMKSVGSARLPHTAGFVGFGTGKLLVGSRRGALDTFELADSIQPHHVGSFVPERVALRSASRDGVWYRPSYQMGIQISPGRKSGHKLPENSNGWYATGGSAVCVAIDGHYAYVANGDAGLLVLDVTDPVAPLRSGRYDAGGYVTDVKLVDQYAFVAAGKAGLVVFDKSDPKVLRAVSEWKKARAAASLAVQDGVAYVNSVDALHALDVSDPSHPMLLGTHEMQAESAYALLRVKGDFVHVLSGEQGTTVVHCRRSSEAPTANTPQQPVATGRNGSSPNPETLTRDSSAPFDVFLAQATAGDNEALSRLVTSCMNRRLSEAETRLAMNAALTKQVQMPASRSLSTWLNLLENMHDEDALTAEESRRYFQNMTLISMTVRPQIRQGDPLPVRFERHQRGGRRFDIATKNLFVSVDDGVSLTVPESQPTMSEKYIGGSNRSHVAETIDLASIGLAKRIDTTQLSTGTHSIQCSLTYAVSRKSRRSPFGSEDLFSEERTFSGEFEILPASAPSTVNVQSSPEAHRWMQESMEFESLRVRDVGSTKQGYVDVRLSCLPSGGGRWMEAPLTGAFDLFVRIGDQEQRLGDLTIHRGRQLRLNPETDWVSIPEFDDEEVIVIMRPSVELALRTADVFATLEKDIELPSIQVDRRTDVDRYIKVLRDEQNPFERGSAARALAKLGPRAKSAVPALCDLLPESGTFGHASIEASKALAQMGPAAHEAQNALAKDCRAMPPCRSWHVQRQRELSAR